MTEVMMAKHRRGVRLMAGQDKQTFTAQELQQREIKRLVRREHTLERERRRLQKRLKAIAKELRLVRKGQKVVMRPMLHTESFESVEGY